MTELERESKGQGAVADNGAFQPLDPPVPAGESHMAKIFFQVSHAELVSASIPPPDAAVWEKKWTLKQVQGDDEG